MVAQGKREAGAERAALGQRCHQFYPLPQHAFCVGGEGRVRGLAVRINLTHAWFIRFLQTDL